MANEYAVNQTDLKAIADAIREKGGTSDALTFPGGFVDAVDAIQAGGNGTDDKYMQILDGSFAGDFVDEKMTQLKDRAFAAVVANNLRFKNVEKAGKGANSFVFQDASTNTIVFDKRVAFSGHQNFTGSSVNKIVFKGGVSNWGSNSFYNCNALTALVVGGEFSPLGGLGYLDGTPIGKGNGFIYVPSLLVDTYKGATNWSVLADYIVAIEDYPGIEEF